MIIAVDYDGTLDINGEMNIPLIRRLAASQKRGDIIILWSCRAGERLELAVQNLKRVGFRPNYVNSNTRETIMRLGYDPRKVLADVYIDDKNAR